MVTVTRENFCRFLNKSGQSFKVVVTTSPNSMPTRETVSGAESHPIGTCTRKPPVCLVRAVWLPTRYCPASWAPAGYTAMSGEVPSAECRPSISIT